MGTLQAQSVESNSHTTSETMCGTDRKLRKRRIVACAGSLQRSPVSQQFHVAGQWNDRRYPRFDAWPLYVRPWLGALAPITGIGVSYAGGTGQGEVSR
jgi:hypothetical protein